MPLLLESSPHLGVRTVLLSIKPKYASLIISGSKKIELRRVWAKQKVEKILIYSSSPVQKIVGLVEVQDVVKGTSSNLWEICKKRNAGLTKEELINYLEGKSQGIGILLGKVIIFADPIRPSEIIENFTPPQSFRYLNSLELAKLAKATKGIGGR